MALNEELANDIASILSQTWDLRDGNVVPQAEDVVLTGGGVRLDATVLYADLADSTTLAMNQDPRVAAKVFRTFLAIGTRLIRAGGGAVRSFDGDRVMGVFVGNYKNTSAAKTALRINWAFLNLLRPQLEAKYPALAGNELKHCTGIDTGPLLAVRAGIRNNNDLVWVGRPPNVAAKLSALRVNPYHTYITGDVYDKLNAKVKTAGNDEAIWEERSWTAFPPLRRIFRSHWVMEP